MRRRTPILCGVALLLLAPLPAWWWWSRRVARPVPLAGPEGVRLAPEPAGREPAAPPGQQPGSRSQQAGLPASSGRPGPGPSAAGTLVSGGLPGRGSDAAARVDPGDRAEVEAAIGHGELRRLLAERLVLPRGPLLEGIVDDWLDALGRLRTRHREALGQHPLLQRLLRGPGDLLFELMPELCAAIREGRVRLVLPPEGAAATGGGAGFRVDDGRGRLLCELPTRRGSFVLELDEGSGDPELWRRMWTDLGILDVFTRGR